MMRPQRFAALLIVMPLLATSDVAAIAAQPRVMPPRVWMSLRAECPGGDFGRFAARLESAAAEDLSSTVRLRAVGTCLWEGRLWFLFELTNLMHSTLHVEVRVRHYTAGGTPMGSQMARVKVRPGTQNVLAESSIWGPFPLRGSDRFVAAIAGVRLPTQPRALISR